MIRTATKSRFTPADLLAMPDSKRFELVDGNLVERDMGWQSSWIGGKLLRLLGNFGEENGQGWVAPADASYQCFPDSPDKVRRPDVSFICRARLPGEIFPPGHCSIAPDLVAQVVSPNDLAYDVDERVHEYLGAGVHLVWVIYPETRSIMVHRPDGTGLRLEEGDELSGETVLPGFRVPVQDIFPPIPATKPAP
jgi:Uma2 family endonuclease